MSGYTGFEGADLGWGGYGGSDQWDPNQLVGGSSPFEDAASTQQSWWQDPKTRTELAGLAKGLGGVKPLADPNAASARPPFPAAGIHQGQAVDALGQYLQMLQARQQALRTQFLPKTAGLLGG